MGVGVGAEEQEELGDPGMRCSMGEGLWLGNTSSVPQAEARPERSSTWGLPPCCGEAGQSSSPLGPSHSGLSSGGLISAVFIVYHCLKNYNKLGDLNSTILVSYSFVGRSPMWVSPGLKSRCWQGCVLF